MDVLAHVCSIPLAISIRHAGPGVAMAWVMGVAHGASSFGTRHVLARTTHIVFNVSEHSLCYGYWN